MSRGLDAGHAHYQRSSLSLAEKVTFQFKLMRYPFIDIHGEESEAFIGHMALTRLLWRYNVIQYVYFVTRHGYDIQK